MKKINLDISINASVEKVWDIVIGDETYREWTSVFCPGSYFKGSWEKGSKILFLGPDPETGGEGGMVSEIADNVLHKYISIKHNGIINNGVEDTTSESVIKWTPSYENYTFEETNDGTLFKLDMDATDEYYEFFLQSWPKALEKIKELSEKA
jgi:uncharacterized protein YndB with AHSA1/START domain